jgi:endonuclease YncB( thermonuclease family)
MIIKYALFVSAAVAAIAILSLSVWAQSPTKQFTICQEGARRIDCVVDGDTFWMDSTKIRIADIDAPEIHPARCEAERDLGEAATFRLLDLLNAGTFDLVRVGRGEDQYGRKLRLVMRGDQSVGAELVSEGVARQWEWRRKPWC